MGQALKPAVEIFLPHSNFADRRQSEVRNFETAQHIDKQKPDVSSTTKCAKNGTKLGASSHGFLQPREKIDKL